MPREAKGPRLFFRKPRKARKDKSAEEGVWLILDRKRQKSTGCAKEDIAGAEGALRDYLTEKHEIPRRQRRLSDIPVSDVLSIYLDDVVPALATAKKAEARVMRLNDWWGAMMMDEVTGAACRQFTKTRGQGAARRELQDLQAAIGHHHTEGLHREDVRVSLPKAGAPRERWLTRSEVARLIRTCRNHREVQEGAATKKRPLVHLVRFILFALHTGSRPGDILNASFMAASDRSFVDLESGLFYRRPTGKAATKKRQPTIPLGPHLLRYLRRWHAKGAEFVVEFEGKRVHSIKNAFYTAIREAKLGPDVVPYTLRHSSATWMMQRGVKPWQVAGYLGTSEAMIEKHYGHHHPDHLSDAANAIGTPQRRPNGRPGTKQEETKRFPLKLQEKLP